MKRAGNIDWEAPDGRTYSIDWEYEESEYGDGSLEWEMLAILNTDEEMPDHWLVPFKEYLENLGELV